MNAFAIKKYNGSGNFAPVMRINKKLIASGQYGLTNNIHVIPTRRYCLLPYLKYLEIMINPKRTEIRTKTNVKDPCRICKVSNSIDKISTKWYNIINKNQIRYNRNDLLIHLLKNFSIFCI